MTETSAPVTVTMMAARVNRGDRVWHAAGNAAKLVVDYRTVPGGLFWTFEDGTEVSVVPTRTFRVEIA